MIIRPSDRIVLRDAARRDDRIEYAIGDVHGCLAELGQALDWCATDAAERGMKGRIHLLGDYVDRGPDSKGVLDALMAGCPDDHMEWLPVLGNHDEILALVWRNPRNAQAAQLWWEHGGQQTLMSFGWNPLDRLVARLEDWIGIEYVEFIESLPHANVAEDVLFVHAGIRPGVCLHDQRLHDLLYIRQDFLRNDEDHGRIVVHGHTPDKANPMVRANRVALDSMCFASGRLSVCAFDPGSLVPRLHVAQKDSLVVDTSPSFGL